MPITIMTITRVAGIAGLSLSLLAATPAGAAEARLTVTVRDNYGVIPRAAVLATHAETGASRRAVTDDKGLAHLEGLASGSYEVRTSFPGFADSVERAVTLKDGETKSLALELASAQLSTTITVETANRREQLLLDVAQPVTLLERAQIQDTGARSAKDVLVEQNGSGVQVNAGGGQGHLSINGIPNKGVLVLVNGRRYLGRDANGNLNFEELRLPGVERIEIVKGAGSAVYGSDAMGGVVNFITGQAAGRGLSNALTLSAGSFADYRVDDTFAWRGESGGVSLAGAIGLTTGSISSHAARSSNRRPAAERTRRRSASPRAATGTPREPPTARSARSWWPVFSATTSCARCVSTSSRARPSSLPRSTTPSAT